MRLSKKKGAALHIKEPDLAGGKAAKRTEQFNRARGIGVVGGVGSAEGTGGITPSEPASKTSTSRKSASRPAKLSKP